MGQGKKERIATFAQKIKQNLGMLQESNHSHKYKHCVLVTSERESTEKIDN